MTGCYATLDAEMPLTVRVWTSLDADALDESFAINNVVIQALGKGISGVFVSGDNKKMSLLNAVVSTVVGVF